MIYAAKDAYVSWALYDAMVTAGSRFVADDKVTDVILVTVVDAGDTTRLAPGVMDWLPAAPSRRRAAVGKRRVRVRILKLFTSGYCLSFEDEHTRGMTPKTLGDLWKEQYENGPPAVFSFFCARLRDALHSLEAGDPLESNQPPRACALAVGPREGVFDKQAEFSLGPERVQVLVSNGEARAMCEDDGSDAEEGGAEEVGPPSEPGPAEGGVNGDGVD